MSQPIYPPSSRRTEAEEIANEARMSFAQVWKHQQINIFDPVALDEAANPINYSIGHVLSRELDEAFVAERKSIEALFALKNYPATINCFKKAGEKGVRMWLVTGNDPVHDIMQGTIQRLYLKVLVDKKEKREKREEDMKEDVDEEDIEEDIEEDMNEDTEEEDVKTEDLENGLGGTDTEVGKQGISSGEEPIPTKGTKPEIKNEPSRWFNRELSIYKNSDDEEYTTAEGEKAEQRANPNRGFKRGTPSYTDTDGDDSTPTKRIKTQLKSNPSRGFNRGSSPHTNLDHDPAPTKRIEMERNQNPSRGFNRDPTTPSNKDFFTTTTETKTKPNPPISTPTPKFKFRIARKPNPEILRPNDPNDIIGQGPSQDLKRTVETPRRRGEGMTGSGC